MSDLAELGEKVEAELHKREAESKGGELWILCPYHGESDPSFAYRPDSMVFYCQGCGASGGVLDLAQKLGLRGGSLSAKALEQLQRRTEENRQRLQELREEKAKALAAYWGAHAEELRLSAENEFLARLIRDGVPGHAIDHFGFGETLYPVHDDELDGWRKVPALTIPWTVAGEIRALQYRLAESIDGRYRWHKGSQPTFFNADAILDPDDSRLIVVEGAKKAASLWGHGLHSVCGVSNKQSWAGLYRAAKREGRLDKWLAPFAQFDAVVFALDPDAKQESFEAAQSLPNGRHVFLPNKPDDMLVATDGDVDLLDVYLRGARKAA